MDNFRSLSVVELKGVKGGKHGFWWNIGNALGTLSGAAADAGWQRAHKYGGRTKY